MKQIVSRIDKATFRLHWETVRGSQLIVNFNPLIKACNLKSNFAFLHWQAKPKGLRRWGIYYVNTDSYYSFDSGSFRVDGLVQSKPFSINENVYFVVPTAVILYENIIVKQELGGTLLVANLKQTKNQ